MIFKVKLQPGPYRTPKNVEKLGNQFMGGHNTQKQI